jgi:ABC-type amino acid transport substrate-binding protein
LTVVQQIKFAFVGPASFFSSPTLAMPFLLDLFRLPADLFQQFVITDVLTSRFGMLLAAMHMTALGLLGAAAMAGKARIRVAAVGRYAALAVTLPLVVILGARGVVSWTMDREYRNYQRFIEMDLSREPAEFTVTTDPGPVEQGGSGPASPDQILERGVLRVAYLKDRLPYAFVNESGRLVGFDVEMAHRLARELGIRVEFLRIGRDDARARLDAGQVDVIMAGVAITTDRMRDFAFTTPYLDHSLAFVVKDHRRHEFSNMDRIARRDDLTIAVPDDPYFLEAMKTHFPKVKVVPMNSPRPFLTQADQEIDALIYSAEAGSAWCLVYPQYSIVVPENVRTKVPLGYAVSHRNPSLAKFLSTWVELVKRDGTVDGLYEYWILGEGAGDSEPRWSVIRDVLGWVD